MRSIARHGVRLLVATAAMAALPALTAVTPAHATDVCHGVTENDHGQDSESGDCVHMEVYTAVDESIVVVYWGNQDYDFYQLRWSRPGRAETQSVVRGEGDAGLLQRVVRLGLHVLGRRDLRQARPARRDVGPGADGGRRRQVGRPDDPRSAFWSAAT